MLQDFSAYSTDKTKGLIRPQKAIWDVVDSGKHVVLSTGTASGKSLAYQLPILSRILKDSQSRSLLLLPTKAFAQDKLKWLKRFTDNQNISYILSDSH